MELVIWLVLLLVLGFNCLESVISASVCVKLKGIRLVGLFVPSPLQILSQKKSGAVSSNFVPRRLWAMITGRVENKGHG